VALVSSASGSQSKDNTKNNRIWRTLKKAKETELEDHPRNVKSSLNKASVVDSRASSSVIKSVSNVNSNLKCASCNGCLFFDNHDACVVAYINSVNASRKSKSAKKPVKRKVVQIVLWYLDSDCSKNMTGDRSQLINFVHKFLGTVKFGNDHVAKIMGYGDYQIRNVMISWVYYVEGLGHNLFSIGQFCDSDLEVAFRQHTCFIRYLEGVDLLSVRRIRTDNGTEFVNQTLRDYYEEVGISHETSVARSSQQNGVVKRRNQTLIEAARTMLIYAQAPLFLWAEAVVTACFTQNRSIICLHNGKTPYELMHGKQPDLSYFHVFGALCYPTNDGENVEKLQPKADI
nr:integrase, catalytic region, zinc finger, CCHC-type, peptidase aspartic, catalytic [Tanacetum cinerariifolium]